MEVQRHKVTEPEDEQNKPEFILLEASRMIYEIVTCKRDVPPNWLQREGPRHIFVKSPTYDNGISVSIMFTNAKTSVGLSIMLEKNKFPDLIYSDTHMLVGLLINNSIPNYAIALFFSGSMVNYPTTTASQGIETLLGHALNTATLIREGLVTKWVAIPPGNYAGNVESS